MRGLMWLAALGLVFGCLAPPAASAGFGLEEVAARAQRLAQEPYREPPRVPEFLRTISYDQWRDIRFRPERALWRDRGLPFEVQFFHPGLFYPHPVAVNVVDGQSMRPVAFSPRDFDYGRNDFAARVPENLGYAGFRVHYPLKTPSYHDEVIVFLGASYFRAVGQRNVYGLSARGLAIDTALDSREEFPAFREFWLVRPDQGARELVLYALLDGPSVAGAYRFAIRPGEQTLVQVDCRIFPRREVEKLGIAPLTSMFFFGENTQRPFQDFRPEVHDSDGLQLSLATGEWLWRPLDNPAGVHVASFAMEGPKGFGLIQRDRDFDHYQDLETQTELRPSVWIEPRGDWGKGRVEIVELPTDSDVQDNVVTLWVPEHRPKPGASATFAYTMYWGDDPRQPPGGRVVATRRDRGNQENVHRLVVDFAGGALAAIPANQEVRAVVTIVGGAAAGELIDHHVVPNPYVNGWRLVFQVRPRQRGPVELRAYLDRGGDTLTETWSYLLQP